MNDKELNQIVIEFIYDLEDVHNGVAPKEVLENVLYEKYEIAEDRIANTINELENKGLIYEPEDGYYRAC